MLVESVPNVSEGRRLDVVERLADALTSVPGVFLLDRTSDPSHNRSVFTVAGEHDAVSAALERLVAQALDDIDMEEHTGEHPRIGAVDVIPFVPLGDTTMDACVELARRFAARIVGALGPPRLPVRPGGDALGSGEARRRPARPVRGAADRDRARTDGSRTSGPPGCTRARVRWPWVPARS